MRAYVYDSIRASLCTMTLDHAFESKEEISLSLKTHLQEIMNSYGVVILNALVTDLSPDAKVRDGKSMHSNLSLSLLLFFVHFPTSFLLS